MRGAHTVRSPPTGYTWLPEAGGGEGAGRWAQSLSPGAPRKECGVLVPGVAKWLQVSVSCRGPAQARVALSRGPAVPVLSKEFGLLSKGFVERAEDQTTRVRKCQ